MRAIIRVRIKIKNILCDLIKNVAYGSQDVYTNVNNAVHALVLKTPKKKTNGLCEKRQPKECIVFIRYYIFCMCRVIEEFAKHSIF